MILDSRTLTVKRIISSTRKARFAGTVELATSDLLAKNRGSQLRDCASGEHCCGDNWWVV